MIFQCIFSNIAIGMTFDVSSKSNVLLPLNADHNLIQNYFLELFLKLFLEKISIRTGFISEFQKKCSRIEMEMETNKLPIANTYRRFPALVNTLSFYSNPSIAANLLLNKVNFSLI